MKMLVVVYDTFDNNRVAFYGDYKEVAKYFKTSVKCIQDNVCRKTLRERRYRIERVDIGEDNGFSK